MPCRVEGATAFVAGQAIRLGRAYTAVSPGHRVELGIRPEFLTLQSAGSGFPVRVLRIDDLGRVRMARVARDEILLSATVPEGFAPDGDQAALRFDPARIHIYADGHLVPGEPVAGTGRQQAGGQG